jgi:pSer/pThr/pTyr-binding forkhead associated (FHA) protein
MNVSRRLIILEDPGKHREVVPQGDTVEIGRSPTLGLVLSDRTVSRHHAVLRTHGNDLVLEDVGSTFGTFVNGDPVTPKKAVPLRDGDVIELGKVQVVCRFEPVDQDTEAAARDAAFAAQSNARILLQEGESVRRWPLASPLTLIGRAPHCEVRLQDRTGPPEQAAIRAQSGRFFLEPRQSGAPTKLNESQSPVKKPTPLESNSVFLLPRAQALFLYDFQEDGAALSDPLLEVSRRGLLKEISQKTGLAHRHLRKLCRSYRALGQCVGELLVQEKYLTPLFWRVTCARLLKAKASSRKGWFEAVRRG